MSSHPYVKGNSLVALTLLKCVSVIKLVPHLFSPSLYHHFPMALGHQRINTDEQPFYSEGLLTAKNLARLRLALEETNQKSSTYVFLTQPHNDD